MSAVREQVMAVLHTVPDPELPVNIVDLGLVEAIDINDDRIEITLLPTFVGCPALDMIRDDVVKALRADGIENAHVEYIFEPAWTVDRITPAGRDALREHGVTVPDRNLPGTDPRLVTLRTSAIACPFCQSRSTRMESPFGPTRCRSIYYCDGCRNTFEHMKRLSAS